MDEKRNWIQALTLALCALLLGLNVLQLSRISDLRGRLGSVEGNLQTETRRLDERLANVQRELRDANELVRDWDCAVSAEGLWLLVDVSVPLKVWRADTVVELLWTNVNGKGGEGYVPLTGDGVGTFSGTLELPLAELSGEYAADVKIINGETQRRESLGYLGDFAGLLPVQCYGWGTGGPNYRDGVLTLTRCEAELQGYEKGDLPQLSGQVFRLRRNGDVAEEKTALYGETINQYACEALSAEARPGDEITLTFFCRDESGLGYEFFLNGWKIDENGIKDAVAPTTDWPRLSWD